MLTIEQKRDFLSRAGLFQGFPADEVEIVARRAGERTLAAGETLFNEGDFGDTVYFVVNGAIEIFKGDAASPHVLAVLESPDFFGEMAVLSEGVRTTSARAKAPTTLLFLKSKAIKILIQNAPAVAFGFFKVLIRRLDRANDTIVMLRDQGKVLAKLSAVQGPDAGRTLAIVRRRVEIGRAGAGGVEDGSRVDLKDPSNRIARAHAEIAQTAGSFYLKALAAGTETLLNGEGVEGAVELADGDEITVGPAVLKFGKVG